MGSCPMFPHTLVTFLPSGTNVRRNLDVVFFFFLATREKLVHLKDFKYHGKVHSCQEFGSKSETNTFYRARSETFNVFIPFVLMVMMEYGNVCVLEALL